MNEVTSHIDKESDRLSGLIFHQINYIWVINLKTDERRAN